MGKDVNNNTPSRNVNLEFSVEKEIVVKLTGDVFDTNKMLIKLIQLNKNDKFMFSLI
jgi:hypothetical protein